MSDRLVQYYNYHYICEFVAKFCCSHSHTLQSPLKLGNFKICKL
ncbi:hypothetical protein NSP_1160 [Nodularia spumigena CCY9414]|nr:hypothetical protein NSP_1160 [Nodularia spumigena CCY9414]